MNIFFYIVHFDCQYLMSWLSMKFLEVVFLVVIMNVQMKYWMRWIFHLIIIYKYRIIPFSPSRNLDNNTNLIWCWGVCRRDNQFVYYCLNVSYFIEDWSVYLSIFLKISSLFMLWWREYYFIFLWDVYLEWLSWLVVLLLPIFSQYLESIHWFYFLQVILGSMGCYLYFEA